MRSENEAQPELAERLRIMARVSSRVAHDFDNILTGVIGFAELALQQLPAGVTKQYVAELLKVGHQGAELTRRLHQLGREVPVQAQPTSLATAWRAVEAPLQVNLPPGTTLEVALPDGLPKVAMEPDALRQALEPVLLNAAEAAPTSPISITAATADLPGAEVDTVVGGLSAGRYVVLTVADRGTGVPPDVRKKLFVEPFFSTKPRHRGLGLIFAYRQLCAHGGGLRLDPADGGGTAARLYLPTVS
ncbi:MAG: ATP-binding protein [Gemmataceae bacterium]